MIEGMDRRIVVVGGGPAGLYSAYLVKKKNPNILVTLFEEHSEIGIPICCSGLIGIDGLKKTDLLKYIIINDCVDNKVKGANIYGPYKSYFKVLSKVDKAYVLDRGKFDKKIRDLALSVGVEIVYDSRVVDVKENTVFVDDLKKNCSTEYKFDFLIGADGPNSIVRKTCFPEYKDIEKEFIIGYQIYVEGEFTKNKVDLYFNDFSRGLFSWVVPESGSSAKIGIGVSLSSDSKRKNNPKEQLYEFIKKNNIIYDKETSFCSALLPISKPLSNFVKDNVIIIGDAGCFVKVTTGGGVNFGLMSAKIAANAITNRIKDFKKLESYNKDIKRYVSELNLHYKIRRYILSKSNSELDELIQKLNDIGISSILEKEGDIDYPSLFIRKLFFNRKFFSLFRELIKFLKS
ncbi:MAG: NAD(P)/FAD-dependent oxidoreductase [archaeon]|nr:NAD(P)/FAD-dependent oxidoreductase [archaeon]MDD2477625.1 NAD(P)/FAD-dependent oxidoreductase [Candidatus ainarchaeum sp.]MDD3084280.1 NAD(P)/FAD-dependent oxidoreductase [Candidatus ainarchaeum sp.]MDD4221021.1 NAD(P)/FAD-dependent oxidoreductase [Candidatus ainarchaeum sp.]MDD4662493.1 NAD(P)/FAD-dependent oxidoreductase [Candidatus ainarchaeum sp.]